ELVEPAGAEVEVPAGHYWLYATAGPEATLARTEVTLAAGEIATFSFALEALAIRPAGWLAADLHVHGRRSFDSGIPDRDRVRSFVAAGVDVIAATDHDVIGDYTAAITALGVADRMLVMGGLETTQVIPWLDVPGEDLPRVIGHFNFWPLTAVPGEPRAGAPWDELVEPGELFDVLDPLIGPDGVRMINHPWDETQFGRDLGYLRAINFDPRAPIDGTLLRAPAGGHRNLDWDVMEVQNGAGADEWAKTRPLWFSLISAGYPVPGAANSDSHGMRDGQVGWGRTWVETGLPLAQTTPSAFNLALRGGRAVAGSGVFIEVAIGPPGAYGVSAAPPSPRASAWKSASQPPRSGRMTDGGGSSANWPSVFTPSASSMCRTSGPSWSSDRGCGARYAAEPPRGTHTTASSSSRAVRAVVDAATSAVKRSSAIPMRPRRPNSARSSRTLLPNHEPRRPAGTSAYITWC
ncbi:MAG: CehA/McbA family metallohydrolase, partial [Deltaproteobacteria bacterium]|nr:CehA/McbA family metallohydrolase [Kofleriaceae bacterium]